MVAQISAKSEEDNQLKFTISDVDVCIVNALRRTIISDISCFVLDSVSDNNVPDSCIIHKNTSRLTNEMIKHRLSNIPVHLNDLTIPIDQYIIKLKVKNDSDVITYVTSQDLKIFNKSNNQPLSASDQKTIFPPNSLTNFYIDILRLQPKISSDYSGEEIDLECNLKIGTAKDNGSYNVASTCSFKNTPDSVLATEQWKKVEEKLKSESNTLTEQEMEYQKKNWFLLEAYRFYIKNSFDFVLESIGIYNNNELINSACNKLLENLKILSTQIQGNEISIEESDVTIENCYDINLINYDHTIGNILNFYMYEKFYEGQEVLSYCGIRQPHPHLPTILLRIAFKQITNKEILNKYLIECIKDGMETIKVINNNF